MNPGVEPEFSNSLSNTFPLSVPVSSGRLIFSIFMSETLIGYKSPSLGGGRLVEELTSWQGACMQF